MSSRTLLGDEVSRKNLNLNKMMIIIMVSLLNEEEFLSIKPADVWMYNFTHLNAVSVRFVQLAGSTKMALNQVLFIDPFSIKIY